MGYGAILHGVQAHIPLRLVGVGWVEQHACEAQFRRGRWTENPRPVATAHPDVAEAGLQGRKPGVQSVVPPGSPQVHALAMHPLPRIPQVHALAMHPPPRIPQVHELAMHALPRIPQVHELSLHPIAVVINAPQLAIDALPWPLAAAPATTDPTRNAV